MSTYFAEQKLIDACYFGYINDALDSIKEGATNFDAALIKTVDGMHIANVYLSIDLSINDIDCIKIKKLQYYQNIAKFLIENGADISKVSPRLKKFASKYIYASLDQLIFMVRGINRQLKTAALLGKLDEVIYLVKQGATNFNQGLKHAQRILQHPDIVEQTDKEQENYFMIMALMINRGADIKLLDEKICKDYLYILLNQSIKFQFIIKISSINSIILLSKNFLGLIKV